MMTFKIIEKDIISIMELGKSEDFWATLCAKIDEAIDILEHQEDAQSLETLSPEQYKFEMALLKAKQKFLRTLKEYPDSIIQDMQEPNNEQPEYDPYQK